MLTFLLYFLNDARSHAPFLSNFKHESLVCVAGLPTEVPKEGSRQATPANAVFWLFKQLRAHREHWDVVPDAFTYFCLLVQFCEVGVTNSILQIGN